MGSQFARTMSSATLWAMPVHGALPMSRARAYGQASDADLIAWSANGDRRAFDEIVTRHGPFALRVAARLIRDPVVAEDIVQDAMVRAWRQASQFDARRAQFTTWLYRIIVNRCIDERRRVRPEVREDPVDQVDPSAAADEVMDLAGRQTALASALRGLPPRQRAALTLVYDEGMSGAEAAQVLGLSNKAVERLLARGRAYLRQRLQQTPLVRRGNGPC